MTYAQTDFQDIDIEVSPEAEERIIRYKLREKARLAIRSLTETSKMNRADERKLKEQRDDCERDSTVWVQFDRLREQTHLNRVGMHRFRSRCTYLAYAYAMGKAYRTVEPKTIPSDTYTQRWLASKVADIVNEWNGVDKDYEGATTLDDIIEWIG